MNRKYRSAGSSSPLAHNFLINETVYGAFFLTLSTLLGLHVFRLLLLPSPRVPIERSPFPRAFDVALGVLGRSPRFACDGLMSSRRCIGNFKIKIEATVSMIQQIVGSEIEKLGTTCKEGLPLKEDFSKVIHFYRLFHSSSNLFEHSRFLGPLEPFELSNPSNPSNLFLNLLF